MTAASFTARDVLTHMHDEAVAWVEDIDTNKHDVVRIMYDFRISGQSLAELLDMAGISDNGGTPLERLRAASLFDASKTSEEAGAAG